MYLFYNEYVLTGKSIKIRIEIQSLDKQMFWGFTWLNNEKKMLVASSFFFNHIEF